jgi:XTP/dITP diphosphohydrolase
MWSLTMPPTPKVLAATTNKGKLKEFQGLFTDLGLEFLTPRDFGIELDIDETGDTYAENAGLKARAYAKLVGIPVLADDSGLEVDALGGAPGIRSARYSPKPGATDADRRQYLLEQLHPFPRPWTARFRCVIAIAESEGMLYFCEGICEGQIIPEARGQTGFGYDPIFQIKGREQTMAELEFTEKNQISHRARAFQAALPILEKGLKK